jgi:hypothetical protein
MSRGVLVARIDETALDQGEAEKLLYYLYSLSGPMTEHARAEYEDEEVRKEKARHLAERFTQQAFAGYKMGPQ